MAGKNIDLGSCASQQAQLNKDIQTGAFKPFYLIWGAEPYIRLQYLDNLTKALLSDSDAANKLVLANDKIDLQEALNFAQTPAFFGMRRVVVIDGGGFFKKSNTQAKKYFNEAIEGAVVIFTDVSADTDSAFYSFVNGIGRTVRCETPNTNYLRRWVEQRLVRGEHKKIEIKTIDYFLQSMDQDMFRIDSEMDKLIAYTADKEEITTKDVSAVCCGADEASVFKLTDAISDRNRKAAFAEYESLMLTGEKPGRMLFRITEQLRRILITAELIRRHMDTDTIAGSIGQASYFVPKYIGWARKIDENKLIRLLEYAIKTDYEIKSGKLNTVVALEMLIAYCTA